MCSWEKHPKIWQIGKGLIDHPVMLCQNDEANECFIRLMWHGHFVKLMQCNLKSCYNINIMEKTNGVCCVLNSTDVN